MKALEIHARSSMRGVHTPVSVILVTAKMKTREDLYTDAAMHLDSLVRRATIVIGHASYPNTSWSS
jgi:hypothetical protein